jgi:MinD-like ATPase involved in chromosome partitioning or flagellar assembly
VAANLATLLVRRGSKVVLVDADLRLAARRRAGDGSTSSGFAGLLVNQLRTASSAVVHTLEPKLKLLPVGSVTGTPATLLRSPRLPLVVDQLRDLADYVVFETPSVLAWQESLDLVRLADVTLLVIETGRTRLSAARLTAAMLRSAGAGELGVVLDRAPSWIIAPEVERPQPRMNVRASQVAAAATPPERLELAVGELLADLEDALKLIRSIRQTTGDTGQSKQEKNTELTAIDS